LFWLANYAQTFVLTPFLSIQYNTKKQGSFANQGEKRLPEYFITNLKQEFYTVYSRFLLGK